MSGTADRQFESLSRTTPSNMPHPAATPPFHLAFPVHDIAAARAFYGDLLGCPEGRSAEHWVDFDFHGHQIVAHLAPPLVTLGDSDTALTQDACLYSVDIRHINLAIAAFVYHCDGFHRCEQRLRPWAVR